MHGDKLQKLYSFYTYVREDGVTVSVRDMLTGIIRDTYPKWRFTNDLFDSKVAFRSEAKLQFFVLGTEFLNKHGVSHSDEMVVRYIIKHLRNRMFDEIIRKSEKYRMQKAGFIKLINRKEEEDASDWFDQYAVKHTQAMDDYVSDMSGADSILELLTDKQHEVVDLLMQGMKPRDIQSYLDIKKDAYDQRVKGIKKKVTGYLTNQVA